ncbi:hypothetical protein PROFUN_01353 [Planoprotostelium fungivorum]|uniref:chitinase n=1 Tax=Planoprotostelium fungivorum TaxID=1890364 RepID=A0A2P6NZW6_9EUKA|nr:hypothetical protein PROFUN_01353 [Planoprotostelium fungivorum]
MGRFRNTPETCQEFSAPKAQRPVAYREHAVSTASNFSCDLEEVSSFSPGKMKATTILLLVAFFALAAAQLQCSADKPCPSPFCCSKWGWCGIGEAWCGKPTNRPEPTREPTHEPTHEPTKTHKPTENPTHEPTREPTKTQERPTVPVPPNNNDPKIVAYLDQPLSWNRDAREFAVPGSVPKYSYNVINLAFWLSTGVADAAFDWAALDDATKLGFVKTYHDNGVKVMVSAFGATEFPTNLDPVTVATNLANFVKNNHLDGVDIDWEDSAAFEVGQVRLSTSQEASDTTQAGKGEAWLVSLTRTLRQLLPRPYLISHAPQAPYFINSTAQYPKGAYLTVDREAGEDIDFYNVQFYNQGDSSYDTCEKLLFTAGGFFHSTSLFEIAAAGVKLDKIVIGKPIGRAGVVNTGFMEVNDIATCVRQAVSKGWKGGVMGWEFKLDNNNWSNTLAAAFH